VPHKDASKRVEYQKQYRRKHAARLKELNTAWRHNNTDRINRNLRKNAYRRLYGFTIEQYDELLAAQGGVCALCGRDKPWGRGISTSTTITSQGTFAASCATAATRTWAGWKRV
jgi:hypothetical protein